MYIFKEAVFCVADWSVWPLQFFPQLLYRSVNADFYGNAAF